MAMVSVTMLPGVSQPLTSSLVIVATTFWPVFSCPRNNVLEYNNPEYATLQAFYHLFI